MLSIISSSLGRLAAFAAAASLSGAAFADPAQLSAYSETLPSSVVKIDMVPVPGGKLKIGEKMVEVKPFYIGKTEIPWEAFDAFVASGPPSKPYDQTKFGPDAIARPSKSYILPDLGWGHHGFPAINLSFDSATMFVRWLSSATKKKYRLPTEAEWEWACRDGSSEEWKKSKEEIDKMAWYKDTGDGYTSAIMGKRQPSKLGIFDMLGNVGEWCTDMEGKSVLCGGDFEDPIESMTPTLRRYFKPDWQKTDPQIPKSRWWLSDAPFCGLRVVCEP